MIDPDRYGHYPDVPQIGDALLGLLLAAASGAIVGAFAGAIGAAIFMWGF